METKELDKKLLASGTRFLPWLGANYEYGLSYDADGKLLLGTREAPGRRILVLGESHYVGEDEVEDFKAHPEPYRDFTRTVVNDYLNVESAWDVWKNTFLKFERSFVNHATTPDESVAIWNQLAFYNYLQVPKAESRMALRADEVAASVKPFFTLLSELRPEIVIVWGKRLYWQLPGDSEDPAFKGENGKDIVVDDYTTPTWVYTADDGYTTRLIPVVHPSWGYSWDWWYQVIRKGVSE